MKKVHRNVWETSRRNEGETSSFIVQFYVFLWRDNSFILNTIFFSFNYEQQELYKRKMKEWLSRNEDEEEEKENDSDDSIAIATKVDRKKCKE